jgi:hypothetical protein
VADRAGSARAGVDGKAREDSTARACQSLGASATPSTAAVLIPTAWTPEQALAVFELFDELRDRLWEIHGCQIHALLQQEQGFAARDSQSSEPNSEDPPF